MGALSKWMGRIGGGQAVHIMFQSVDVNGREYFYTACGADHATNRSALRPRGLKPLEPGQVTCKRCLKRLQAG